MKLPFVVVLLNESGWQNVAFICIHREMVPEYENLATLVGMSWANDFCIFYMDRWIASDSCVTMPKQCVMKVNIDYRHEHFELYVNEKRKIEYHEKFHGQIGKSRTTEMKHCCMRVLLHFAKYLMPWFSP